MSLKLILRNLRIKIGKIFLDKKTPHTEKPISNVKNILFLRQDGKIGDYIVSSFVFRELKKNFPQIKIDVICASKNKYLFENNRYIDNLYLVKTKSIIDGVKCGLKLRKNNYDVIIDPTVLLRNRDLLLLRLINAGNYIGYRKEHYKIFNFNITDPHLHFSEIYKEALDLLGIHDADTRYEVPYFSQAAADVSHFIQQNKLQNFITVNFYGAGNKRSFSDERISRFLDYFSQFHERQFVILTFPKVTEKLKRLIRPYDNIYIYENTQHIFHTIELIRQAVLLISPDTSTVHIAAGLNKKLICFYSDDEENFIHWHPNNRNTTHILRYKKSVNELEPVQILPEWL